MLHFAKRKKEIENVVFFTQDAFIYNYLYKSITTMHEDLQ
jgi:hypothetical protein